jgi:Family of unknown function (DUF6687)
MRFIPYTLAATLPNIVVDGAAAAKTVLTLSHWPRSGTPARLRADTSAEIVFNYLDTPSVQVEVDAATNNHFDEDGLIGIFALTEPTLAASHRTLLVDVAKAGDFGIYRSRSAARIAFVLAAYSDRGTSPLPAATFTGPYPDVIAKLYQQLLPLLPRFVMDVDEFRRFWEAEDRRLGEGEALLDRQVVTIECHDDLDLAIVRVPSDVPVPPAMALHTRAPHSRLMIVHGESVELQYRYEGWVQFASRPIAGRVDLTGLAADLTAEEIAGRWSFDGVDQITPRLSFDGKRSALPVDEVVRRMMHALRDGRPAWDPYAIEVPKSG